MAGRSGARSGRSTGGATTSSLKATKSVYTSGPSHHSSTSTKSSDSSHRSSAATKSSDSSHHSSAATKSSGTPRDPHKASSHRDSSRDPRDRDSSRDSRDRDSSRDSRPKDSGRDSRPSDFDRRPPRSSNNSRPDPSRQGNGQGPPPPLANRQCPPLANGQYPPRGSGQGGGGGRPSSPPLNAPPRKRGLRDYAPSGYQIQETVQTLESLPRLVTGMTDSVQEVKSMMGRNNQGPRPGQFDDEDDFAPSPGGDSPGGRRPPPGRGGGRGRNDVCGPSPGGGFTPGDDDWNPSPDDRGPNPFDKGSTNNNSRSSAPRNGRGGGGGRNDDFVPSPGGSDSSSSEDDSSSSEDDLPPSPANGRGRNCVDQRPKTKTSSSSAPPSGRGPNAGPSGNRNGPSPLGPGGSNQTRSNPQAVGPPEYLPFEKCGHEIKVMNGPSGAGPYNYSGNPAPWLRRSPNAFAGYCLPCDTRLRRDQEQKLLDTNQSINIKQVWNGWNQRWKNPVLTGFTQDGKALLKTV